MRARVFRGWDGVDRGQGWRGRCAGSSGWVEPGAGVEKSSPAAPGARGLNPRSCLASRFHHREPSKMPSAIPPKKATRHGIRSIFFQAPLCLVPDPDRANGSPLQDDGAAVAPPRQLFSERPSGTQVGVLGPSRSPYAVGGHIHQSQLPAPAGRGSVGDFFRPDPRTGHRQGLLGFGPASGAQGHKHEGAGNGNESSVSRNRESHGIGPLRVAETAARAGLGSRESYPGRGGAVPARRVETGHRPVPGIGFARSERGG